MKRQEIAAGSWVTEMNAGWYYVEKIVDYYVVENLNAVQFHGEAPRFVLRRTALMKQGFTGSGKPKKTIVCSACPTALCRPLDEEKRRAAEDFFRQNPSAWEKLKEAPLDCLSLYNLSLRLKEEEFPLLEQVLAELKFPVTAREAKEYLKKKGFSSVLPTNGTVQLINHNCLQNAGREDIYTEYEILKF